MGREQAPVGERRSAPRQARGAGSDRSWRDPLDSYLAHHRKTAVESWRRMLAAPLASLMTWVVMGIAMALPVCLMLLLMSLESVSAGWGDAARVNVYLADNATEAQALALRGDILARDDVSAITFISQDQALEEFRVSSGLGAALDYLD